MVSGGDVQQAVCCESEAMPKGLETYLELIKTWNITRVNKKEGAA